MNTASDPTGCDSFDEINHHFPLASIQNKPQPPHHPVRSSENVYAHLVGRHPIPASRSPSCPRPERCGACAFPQGLDVTKNLEYLQRDGVCMLRWCSTIRRGEDRSGNDIIGPKDRCNQSSCESRDSLYVVMEFIIINSSYSRSPNCF